MKGVFFCHALWGLGHFKRSLAICKQLAKQDQIVFLDGSKELSDPIHLENVRYTPLHPISIYDYQSFQVSPQKNQKMFLNKFKIRIKQWKSILTDRYDYLIFEGYPFGKLFLHPELHLLIKWIKMKNPDALIISSYRGIYIDKPKESKVNKQLNFSFSILENEFDLALIHTDPEFIKLEETVLVPKTIRPKLHYTGFVTEKNFLNNQIIHRTKQILITAGSGLLYGTYLMRKVAEVAPRFAQYTFKMAMGPRTTKEEKDRLYDTVKQIAANNIAIVPFLDDFANELRKSSLSISHSGSSVLTIYNTKTPALLYPATQYDDQAVFARKFSEYGGMIALKKEQLKPDNLEKAIRKGLNLIYPSNKSDINLNGAENSALFLHKKILEKS